MTSGIRKSSEVPITFDDVRTIGGGAQFIFREQLTDPATLQPPKDSVFRTAVAQNITGQAAYNALKRAISEQPTKRPMTEVTKDLLDARLEAVEARMDARMVAIDAKFDALQKALLQQSNDLKNFKTDIQTGLADFKNEVHRDNKSTRSTIVTTGVAAVLSIVLGVAAFNATVLSNMVASFESGRNTAQALSDAASKLEKAQAAKDEAKPKDPAPQGK